MSSLQERFKTYFRENCPFTTEEDLDEILAFIEEEVAAAVEDEHERQWATARNLERQRILGLIEQLRGKYQMNYEVSGFGGGMLKFLDDLLSKIRGTAFTNEKAGEYKPLVGGVEPLTKVDLDRDVMPHLSQEETECSKKTCCTIQYGEDAGVCMLDNCKCHKPRTENTEKEGASFSGPVWLSEKLPMPESYTHVRAHKGVYCDYHHEICDEHHARPKETTTLQSFDYEKVSHTHCWNQKQPSACSIPLANHKQCCLCSTPQSREQGVEVERFRELGDRLVEDVKRDCEIDETNQ